MRPDHAVHDDTNLDTEDTGPDSGPTRSGVFRRVMARDMYELEKRIHDLEQSAAGIFGSISGLLPYIAISAVFLVLFLGTILYLSDRIAEINGIHSENYIELQLQLDAQRREADRLVAALQTESAINADHRNAATQTNPADPPAEVTPTERPEREPIGEDLQPGEVLLIVASTPSEDEALGHARRLEAAGHNSEVILSNTGYYGVAIGRFTYEHAKNMKEIINESGVETSSAYIMGPSSVTSYVYP